MKSCELVININFSGDEILDLLLAAKNVNVNAPDDDRATPLHYACLKNNYKAVRKLINTKDIILEVIIDFIPITPLSLLGISMADGFK